MFNFFKKRKRKNRHIHHSRTRVLIGLFTFLFVVITLRLIYATLLQESDYVPKKEKSRKEIQEYQRVSIVDRHGTIIATDVDTVSLYFNRDLITQPSEASISIANTLDDVDMNGLFNKLNNKKSNAKYILVKRNLTPKEQLKVKRLGIAGTVFTKDKCRLYPHKNLFSHIIGYTDTDRNGLSGLEKQYDEYLKDKNHSPLKTTLDLRIQGIAREELIKGMLKYKAKAIVGIVANIKTGEILSAVSLPDFNPNYLRNVPANKSFNRITYGVYEMGSIFKLFNTALGLDQNLISLGKEYEVAEPIKYDKFIIRDMQFKKRVMSVEEILVYSSNVGSAKIALDLGIKNQINFLSSLGLLEKVDAEFPSLATPLFPKKWREVNLMTISYGHGIAVTPLHVIQAVSAIVNDGVKHNIKLTDQTEDFPERVISSNTSNKMRKLMRKSVTNGTSWRANTLGYLVGGKTGTAEKVSDEGGYDENSARVTFVASFPMDDPQIIVFVMVDDPDGSEAGRMNTGGDIAAPIASKIIENVAPVLGIEPRIADL